MVNEMFDLETLMRVARKVQSDRVSAARAMDRVASAAERIQNQVRDSVRQAFSGVIGSECSPEAVKDRILGMTVEADAAAELLLAEVRLEDAIQAGLKDVEAMQQAIAKRIRASLGGMPDGE